MAHAHARRHPHTRRAPRRRTSGRGPRARAAPPAGGRRGAERQTWSTRTRGDAAAVLREGLDTRASWSTRTRGDTGRRQSRRPAHAHRLAGGGVVSAPSRGRRRFRRPAPRTGYSVTQSAAGGAIVHADAPAFFANRGRFLIGSLHDADVAAVGCAVRWRRPTPADFAAWSGARPPGRAHDPRTGGAGRLSLTSPPGRARDRRAGRMNPERLAEAEARRRGWNR